MIRINRKFKNTAISMFFIVGFFIYIPLWGNGTAEDNDTINILVEKQPQDTLYSDSLTDTTQAIIDTSQALMENELQDTLYADALTDTVQTASDSTTIDSVSRIVKPLPFGVGEELNFEVSFEFVKGGEAKMSVESIDEFNGHPCYKIVSTARSTGTVDFFYKVRDRIESWRDVKGGFSRLFVKQLNEGKHKYRKRLEYLPDQGIAYLFEKRHPKIPDTLEVIGKIHDVLGAFYQMRAMPLTVDSSVWIDVHDIRDRYQLEVRVIRREKLKVPAGTFNCLVIEPLLESSGLFRKEGDMQVWITDDQYRMPVMMKSWLYFGRVFAKLKTYKYGKPISTSPTDEMGEKE
jgi:hypothetical protein